MGPQTMQRSIWLASKTLYFFCRNVYSASADADVRSKSATTSIRKDATGFAVAKRLELGARVGIFGMGISGM